MGSHSTASGHAKDGEFTVVEDPEAGPRALAVRRVTERERRTVWRWGGFLFATAAEAEQFARDEAVQGEHEPPFARRTFSHKRVAGRRIYVQQGKAI